MKSFAFASVLDPIPAASTWHIGYPPWLMTDEDYKFDINDILKDKCLFVIS